MGCETRQQKLASRTWVPQPTAPRCPSPMCPSLPPARVGLRCSTTNYSSKDGWEERKSFTVGKGRWCSEGEKKKKSLWGAQEWELGLCVTSGTHCTRCTNIFLGGNVLDSFPVKNASVNNSSCSFLPLTLCTAKRGLKWINLIWREAQIQSSFSKWNHSLVQPWIWFQVDFVSLDSLQELCITTHVESTCSTLWGYLLVTLYFICIFALQYIIRSL